MNEKINVEQHYATPQLLQHIEDGLRKLGKSIDDLSPDDLAVVDELHTRGLKSTYELIEMLDVNPNMHVLDIGAGIGGPARQLAKATDCHVTCIDLTPDFFNTGKTLTKYCRLQHKVTHIIGDATNMHQYQNSSFDAAWTLHAGMNISNKTAYYQEAFRVLKPGAKFVIYDVFIQEISSELVFPLPWANNPKTSFLITQEQLMTYLQESGFDTSTIFDKTDGAITFFQQSLKKLQESILLPPLGPQLIMGDLALLKIQNLLKNLQQSRLSVRCIVCAKPNISNY